MPYYIKVFDKPLNVDESRVLNQKIISIDSSAKLVINPDKTGFAKCWIERPDDDTNGVSSQASISQSLVEIVESYFLDRG